MKKPLPLIIGLIIISSMLNAQTPTKDQYNLLIGTYTKSGKSEGIYVYNFNVKTGESSYKATAAGVDNPSYLAVSADKKHVYAVNENGKGTGAVSAFDFNAASGKLTLLNRQNSGGDGPCYVSVDDKGSYVFVANYGGGSLSAIPVLENGSLGDDIQTINHEGGSIDKSRQEKPHVHSVVLSPDNKFLLSADLGTDKINVYGIKESKKSQPLLAAQPAFIAVKAGSGPRHITFHPNGKLAYLTQEMEGAVTVFDYEDGKLTAKQSITMLPEGFTGKTGAADIRVSPDGRFLYASNRGDADEIVIYAINSQSGKLSYAARQPTLGKTPRNFAIDPTGNFLLAANQNSDEVIIFKRDKKTGLLTPTGKKIAVGSPVCLKFVL